MFDMMKGNPKLDFETVGDVETFQYRDKYKIKYVRTENTLFVCS